MKILFISEYFYPYIHGGAELSVQLLAKKINATVLTPNYGKAMEIDGLAVERFPWPLKLNRFSGQLSPIFFANPFTWLYLAIVIIWKNQSIKADIFHCQSANSFPGVWLAAKLQGKKSILNIRDNQILCNYGWCLSNNKKVCNLKNYFLDDFKHYYQDKVKNKNLLTLIANILFAINGRIRCNILKFFANLADERVCASNAQQQVLGSNGLHCQVIYNIFTFSKPPGQPTPKKEILYATKLSEGKGLGLLLKAWVIVNHKNKNLNLKIVGDGDVNYYKNVVKTLNISKSVSFSFMPSFEKVREIRKRVLLEAAPSIYPESFGRAALEALALGIPVVSSDRGGLKEIVENGITGYVVEPTESKLAEAIIKGVENNLKLRANIKQRYLFLKEKFEEKPVKQYLDLYEHII